MNCSNHFIVDVSCRIFFLQDFAEPLHCAESIKLYAFSMMQRFWKTLHQCSVNVPTQLAASVISYCSSLHLAVYKKFTQKPCVAIVQVYGCSAARALVTRGRRVKLEVDCLSFAIFGMLAIARQYADALLTLLRSFMTEVRTYIDTSSESDCLHQD